MAWGPALLATLVGLVAAGPLTEAQNPSGVSYELVVDCPEQTRNAAVDPNDVLCPIKAIDADDILGSPSVGVDPKNPQNIVFASLHGTDEDGPTERSRGRQPFTTHISTNHGASWQDRPYFPPDDVSGAYGEHAQIIVDPERHVYVGSLYALPDQDMPNGYRYRIGAQKFESIQNTVARQNMRGDYNLQWVDTVYEGNVVEQFWYLYDPASASMTVIWNDVKPQPAGGVDPDNSTKSVIGMVWTVHPPRIPYKYIPEENQVGPCIKTTNPVLADGKIYIGCLVNTEEALVSGYEWDPSPRKGQIDLFRLDLFTGRPEFMGHAPITGGNPKLGARSDGRLFLVTTDVGVDGTTRIFGAFARYEEHQKLLRWGGARNYGPDLAKPLPGTKTLEVNVQDILFREHSGVVHMIIKQRYQFQGLTIDDPTALTRSGIHKQLVAVDEKFGIVGGYNFDIGNVVNRTLFPSSRTPPGDENVYNDLTDDLIELPEDNFTYRGRPLGDNYQREFFAVADYGIVIFAELIELTNLQGPGVPPPAAPPAPIATAALSVNVTTVILATSGLALAGLLALRLALNRQKIFTPSTAKSEK